MRKLVLGSISHNFNPTIDIPLSPFCFIDKEEIFPDWECLEFSPDPFSDINFLIEAEKKTDSFIFPLISQIANELNKRNDTKFSKKFWEILILPFLYIFVHVVYERQARLEQIIKKYKNERIFVELLSEKIHWDFKDTRDFLYNGVLNTTFNHWLLSRILEKIIPKKWEAVYEEIKPEKKHKIFNNVKKERTLKSCILKKLKFNRCGLSSGIGIVESIFWSAYLNIKPASKNTAKKESEKKLYNGDQKIFKFEIMPILLNSLPKCFSDLNLLKIPSVKPMPGKIRLVGNSLYCMDDLKYFYGICVEGGEKLVCTQHGGGGCYYKIIPNRREIEHSQHRYFSWGWLKQEKYGGNIMPMPSPFLKKFKDKHKQKKNTLILVGTATPMLCYRLASEPQSRQYITYRKEKVKYINNLKSKIFYKSLYRPYFNSLGTLEDRKYIEKKIPGLSICENKLHDEILKCRILIIDHPGTTFSIAMVANIPTICFWNKQHWPMSKQSLPFFEEMRRIGILFNSGKAAASKTNTVWNDVQNWWSKSNIQNLRKDFCHTYARTSKFWRLEWAKELWKL